MAGPPFFLQVADDEGTIVRLRAGGTLERDFIEACVASIAKRPVGVFRTEAAVIRAIREGITEAIRDLKTETVKGWR